MLNRNFKKKVQCKLTLRFLYFSVYLCTKGLWDVLIRQVFLKNCDRQFLFVKVESKKLSLGKLHKGTVLQLVFKRGFTNGIATGAM